MPYRNDTVTLEHVGVTSISGIAFSLRGLRIIKESIQLASILAVDVHVADLP